MDQKLETFLTLCKTMHYGRAAELLHLSQPAVSKHIQALEAQYGVRLFTYQARRLQKTREGDLLESYSEKALRDVRQRHATASTLAPFAAQHGLTDKETSVFFLLAAGKTSQEVAGELYLAGSTVRVHSSRIYQKLGVHSREEFDALVKGL